jgi:hypothetical protein
LRQESEIVKSSALWVVGYFEFVVKPAVDVIIYHNGDAFSDFPVHSVAELFLHHELAVDLEGLESKQFQFDSQPRGERRIQQIAFYPGHLLLAVVGTPALVDSLRSIFSVSPMYPVQGSPRPAKLKSSTVAIDGGFKFQWAELRTGGLRHQKHRITQTPKRACRTTPRACARPSITSNRAYTLPGRAR